MHNANKCKLVVRTLSGECKWIWGYENGEGSPTSRTGSWGVATLSATSLPSSLPFFFWQLSSLLLSTEKSPLTSKLSQSSPSRVPASTGTREELQGLAHWGATYTALNQSSRPVLPHTAATCSSGAAESSRLRCAVSAKDIPDFRDPVTKRIWNTWSIDYMLSWYLGYSVLNKMYY